MMDIILDSLIDTLKLLPYLLVTFIILEFIEHKLSKKNEQLLVKNKKYGPFVGGLLGGLPQCGFGTIVANLFSSRVVTLGTVVAVFLATSDEMLPLMISEKVDILVILKIIGFKVLIGIIIGIIADIFYKDKSKKPGEEINHMCHDCECSCQHDGIIKSSIKHTLKIAFFVLIANLLIGFILYFIGEDNISRVLLNKSIWTYFLASLIGLIPNCASSVIITKLYLADLITAGLLLSGLLTGSGLGILILFRSNKEMKENMLILTIIYVVGVMIGIFTDLIGIIF